MDSADPCEHHLCGADGTGNDLLHGVLEKNILAQKWARMIFFFESNELILIEEAGLLVGDAELAVDGSKN